MFKKMLFASDLSDLSKQALQAALTLATDQGAEATLLFVNEKHHVGDHWLTPFFAEEVKTYQALLTREDEACSALLRKRADESLATLKRSAKVVTLVREGRAAETIVAVASEIGADLVVVGTRGRRGKLGSVAEHVVREADCPVLVVPFERVETT